MYQLATLRLKISKGVSADEGSTTSSADTRVTAGTVKQGVPTGGSLVVVQSDLSRTTSSNCNVHIQTGDCVDRNVKR